MCCFLNTDCQSVAVTVVTHTVTTVGLCAGPGVPG